MARASPDADEPSGEPPVRVHQIEPLASRDLARGAKRAREVGEHRDLAAQRVAHLRAHRPGVGERLVAIGRVAKAMHRDAVHALERREARGARRRYRDVHAAVAKRDGEIPDERSDRIGVVTRIGVREEEDAHGHSACAE